MTTSRERLLAVLHGEIPDCVPVCPDISNMVPARRTGKPFWEIYVYQDPPLWKAYIDAIQYYDLDGGFEVYSWGDLFGDMEETWDDYIVARRPDGSFVTQARCRETGAWAERVRVHTRDNPPASNVLPAKLGLPAEPSAWEEIVGVKEWPTGIDLWKHIRQEMGDQGVLGMPSGGTTGILTGPEDVYAYYDDPTPFRAKRDRMIERVERRLETIAALDVRPDFLFCGAPGTLIWQTPAIFRDLGLPVLQRATELAYDLGIPTHVHSCGPEKDLVRIAALETHLTVIDPLEVPPMGDCNLSELKRLYGDQIVLKGNLHTTQVMLHGAPGDVAAASRQAIDDAGAGGGFILSTGDQCGRDTPDENITALVDVCEKHGRY